MQLLPSEVQIRRLWFCIQLTSSSFNQDHDEQSRISNASASFPDGPSAGQVLLLLAVAVAEAAGRTDGAGRSLSCRRSAAAEQESARALPPRGRRGRAGAPREGGGGEGEGRRRRRGCRRHHVLVRPERGDQGGEGAPQGVPEGGEGGGEDAAGVAGGRGRRRRRGQVPEGRRLRQGVHQGVHRWVERPAGRRQGGVLRRVGECHQIVGGVLLQGRTLRLASGRREKQDPGRSQHRRRLPLDLYVMLSSIVLPLNAEKNKNCIPVLLPTTKHSMQYHRSIVLR